MADTPPCVDLAIPLPDLPSLTITAPIVPPLNPLTGDFCCQFEIVPPEAVQAAIAVLNAVFTAAAGEVNEVLGDATAEIMTLYVPLLHYRHILSLSCPLNSEETSI